MASRRSLGGGRVLGSGRNLSPAAAAATTITATPNLLLSPSESSVSLSSQTSNSPATTAEPRDDIGSRVLAAANMPSPQASASTRLVCPICSDEMVCPPTLAHQTPS